MSEGADVKDAISVVRNRRTDAMFVVACLFVGWLVYLVVYQTAVGEFAQGVVTLVLGVFLNELKNMYSFETGTTRGEVAKADTLKALAEKQASATERRQDRADTVVQEIAKSVPAAAAVAAAAAVTATMTPATTVMPWVTGKDYTTEVVTSNGSGLVYGCVMPHRSGVWKDDLAAGKWALKN